MIYLYMDITNKRIKSIVNRISVKRIFDNEAKSSETTSNSQENNHKKDVSTNSEQEINNNNDGESSISEAGEVANVEYTVPPLTLLNQPVKQQSTSKAEVQRKGQILESTMKNFGVNAKVTQIKNRSCSNSI